MHIQNRTALIWLALGSGGASVAHQILWTRRITDLVGATAVATSRVFVCFFLGIALGSAVISWVLKRPVRPWRILAAIELLIAAFSIPIILISKWSPAIYSLLGPENILGWRGALIRLGISAALLLPPATLMGGTLPIMMLLAGGEDGGGDAKKSIRIYAIYTAGGVLGLALLLLWSLPAAGVNGSITVFCLLNVLLGTWCLSRDRRAGPMLPARPLPALPTSDARTTSLALLVGCFSGLGIMGLELLSVHMVNLAAPVAFYPPGVVLGILILLLALAAASTPRFCTWLGSAASAVPVLAVAAGLCMACAPILFRALPAVQSAELGYSRSLVEFVAIVGAAALLAIGPAAFCAGALFPLAMRIWIDRQGTRRAAVILAANGLCGVAGAELAEALLLPHLGPYGAIGTVGVLYAIVGVAGILLVRAPRRGWRSAVVVGSLLTAIIATLFTVRLPVFTWSKDFELLDLKFGREGTLAVVKRPGFGTALMFDNAYLLGSTDASPDERRQTHLPLLLHPQPRDVAFIGLGTGVTASGALQHGAVQSVTAIELSPLVAAASAKHFSAFNGDLAHNPKCTIRVEDARTYLAAEKHKFDVIIGDLFIPWRPGEARLCSLEQVQTAYAALRSGGVYCQWLPMHQLSPDDFSVILSTFSRVFPKIYLWRLNLHNKSLPVAIVGYSGTDLSWNTVAERCRQERDFGKLTDPFCRHPEGVAMLYLGKMTAEEARTDTVNTLGNLLLELSASAEIVTGSTHHFTGTSDAWVGFLRERVQAIGKDPELPQTLHTLPNTGFLISLSELAQETSYPGMENLEVKLLRDFPKPVIEDTRADWSLWPAGTNFLRVLQAQGPRAVTP